MKLNKNLLLVIIIFVNITTLYQLTLVNGITNSQTIEKGDICYLEWDLLADYEYYNKTLGEYYIGESIDPVLIDHYPKVRLEGEWFWENIVGVEVGKNISFSKSSQWSSDNLALSNPVWGKQLVFRISVISLEHDSSKASSNSLESYITPFVDFFVNIYNFFPIYISIPAMLISAIIGVSIIDSKFEITNRILPSKKELCMSCEKKGELYCKNCGVDRKIKTRILNYLKPKPKSVFCRECTSEHNNCPICRGNTFIKFVNTKKEKK